MRLKDKRIFITAAGQGIGRAIAEACIKEGARVVASDLNGSLVDDLDCETCALDVTKKEAISKTIRAADPEVLCNCISPGTVDSPSLQDRLAATGDYDAAMKAFIARQPMGRLGTVEEMGHLAVYLASDESKYMTGQEVRIDGGTTA